MLRHRRARQFGIAAAIVLAIFLAWEGLTSIVAYTDDAFVRSDLVGVAPEVSGRIVAVHVRDNQAVHRGDRLVSIDPLPFQLAVDARRATLREAMAQQDADRDHAKSAQDQVAAAQAELKLAQQTEARAASLARVSVTSQQTLDAAQAALRRAQADLDAASATVAQSQQVLARDDAAISRAKAELGTAEWELSRCEVLAPVDGTINNLTTRPGDTGRIDVPLIGIVDAGAWRIIANYKQYYLRGFQVGGTAWIWLDSHPWRFYRARIEGVARAISRTPDEVKLLPYVEPTTDWIRLQRRFPVTLVLTNPPPDLPLYMGADARVVIFP